MFRTVALNAWSPPLVAPPPQRNPGGLGPRRTGTHSSPCSALRRPGNQALQCQAHFTTRRGHYLTFLGFIFSRCDSRVVQSLCRCNVRPDAAGTCRLCAALSELVLFVPFLWTRQWQLLKAPSKKTSVELQYFCIAFTFSSFGSLCSLIGKLLLT